MTLEQMVLQFIGREFERILRPMIREELARAFLEAERRKAKGASDCPSLSQMMEKEEAAKLLHKSVSWVLWKARLGALPSTHVGQKRLFKRADLERWIEEQSRKGR